MGFAINTNLGSLKAYNALAKVNSETEKAQLRLASMKKINSVADDTSGFNVSTKLQAQILQQKAQLNNASSAKNYLSTAETALEQINDKLNQISAKYTDSQDTLKDSASIAKDIRTLAGEIDSILKNTNINGHQLLASTDGTTALSAPTFNIGGSSFAVDFASDSFFKVGTLSSALHGSTDQGAASFDGSTILLSDAVSPGNQTSVITTTFKDGTTTHLSVNTNNCSTKYDLISAIYTSAGFFSSGWSAGGSFNPDGHWTVQSYEGSNIMSMSTTSGWDITGAMGITKQTSGGVTGGLMDSNDSTVLSAAQDISTISNNIKTALGRIGNLSQTVDSRSDFLTSAIANNTASVSGITDADMAYEQLNATKGNIGSQIATTMLSQMNTAPQNLLSLFR